MVWLKAVVAIVLTVLALSGIAAAFAQVSGLWRVELPSVGGVSAPDARALNEPYLDLAAGREDALVGRLADGVDRETARAQFQQLRQYIPAAPESSSRLLRWTSSFGGGQQLFGIHEREYPDHVVRVETTLVRSASSEAWRVQGLHVRVAQRAELAANAFTLNGKPAGFLAFIAAVALIPLVLWATALCALFWKNLKHRWLWVLFICIGAGQVSMNGATGAIGVMPISIQLFGSGATWSGSAFEPWIFSLSLPVGALVFWVTRLGQSARRRKLRKPELCVGRIRDLPKAKHTGEASTVLMTRKRHALARAARALLPRRDPFQNGPIRERRSLARARA
jgi:hypothetical protein